MTFREFVAADTTGAAQPAQALPANSAIMGNTASTKWKQIMEKPGGPIDMAKAEVNRVTGGDSQSVKNVNKELVNLFKARYSTTGATGNAVAGVGVAIPATNQQQPGATGNVASTTSPQVAQPTAGGPGARLAKQIWDTILNMPGKALNQLDAFLNPLSMSDPKMKAAINQQIVSMVTGIFMTS